MKRLAFVLFLMSRVLAAEGDSRLATALSSINGEDMLRHIRVLSSDEFEGRAPASKGEDLTVTDQSLA